MNVAKIFFLALKKIGFIKKIFLLNIGQRFWHSGKTQEFIHRCFYHISQVPHRLLQDQLAKFARIGQKLGRAVLSQQGRVSQFRTKHANQHCECVLKSHLMIFACQSKFVCEPELSFPPSLCLPLRGGKRPFSTFNYKQMSGMVVLCYKSALATQALVLGQQVTFIPLIFKP